MAVDSVMETKRRCLRRIWSGVLQPGLREFKDYKGALLWERVQTPPPPPPPNPPPKKNSKKEHKLEQNIKSDKSRKRHGLLWPTTLAFKRKRRQT